MPAAAGKKNKITKWKGCRPTPRRAADPGADAPLLDTE
jgi:hypothetical protein